MVLGYNHIGGEEKERNSVMSLVIKDRSQCYYLSFHFLNLNGNIRAKACIKPNDDRLKEVLQKNQYIEGGYINEGLQGFYWS